MALRSLAFDRGTHFWRDDQLDGASDEVRSRRHFVAKRLGLLEAIARPVSGCGIDGILAKREERAQTKQLSVRRLDRAEALLIVEGK